MRFYEIIIAALITLLLLTACGGDPGGHNPYDGVWTMSYSTGIANTAKTTCSIPTTLIDLSNGSGTAKQIETCTYSASGVPATTTTTDILTSVFVGAGIKAIVNGTTLSGSCISLNGCLAQDTTSGGGAATPGAGTASVTLIR